MEQKRKTIEWHPAFTASLQSEFEDEADKIIFESEHLLSKKPMQIDELVIKVHDNEKIQKNIGRIFRKHNIVEYKSPEDYLTINDFYKVYGYCCFYQSDTEHVCEIPPEELTITFICNHYPRNLIQHLEKVRKLQIKKEEPGIYYFVGDAIPIQLLITKELNLEENRWLGSLRSNIKNQSEIEAILKEYEEKKNSKLYQAAMEVITRANWAAIKEAKPSMCEALKELMAEEFQELEEQVTERVTEQVTEQVTERVTERVTEQVTEQVTERVTEQLVKNLYENVGNAEKVAEMLKLPIETVRRIL